MPNQNGNVRLSATIAIGKQVKSGAEAAQTKFLQSVTNLSRGDSSPLSGIFKTFKPLAEDTDGVESERRPDESTLVTFKVEDALASLKPVLQEYYDNTATQETGNTVVKANVVVDGEALIEDAPVGLLLFLEKKMDDLRQLFSSLPTLPRNEKWERDDNDPSLYATPEALTRVTKKLPRNHVKAPATDKHPAQVEVYYEDTGVGFYHTVKFSGAISVQRKNELLSRVDQVRKAVKIAREEANSNMVARKHIGETILGFIMDPD